MQIARVLIYCAFVAGVLASIHPACAEDYIELPIVGQIGSDVTPDYVKQVLDNAASKNVEHVVLRINTGGGFVPPAEAITKVLLEYDDQFQYHAVIEKCVSAGIWMAYTCELVFMTNDAIWGAAAIHDTLDDNTTRYNEKSSAIYAAQIAVYAQSRGHSPVLVRGMVVTGAEVWSWTDRVGQLQLTGYRPDPGTYETLTALDTEHTLLTLTSPEAVSAGVALAIGSGGLDGMGEQIGLDSWNRKNDFGVVLSVHRRFRRNLDEFYQFNENLRNDPNLLTWKDFRHDGLIPSLFGSPSPGLSREQADEAYQDIKGKLEAAYAEVRRVSLEQPDSSNEGEAYAEHVGDNMRAAWEQMDLAVSNAEATYLELTGIEADLRSLKHWPGSELVNPR